LQMRAAQDAERMGAMQERISQLCDHISELETRAAMATAKASNDYTAEREGWTKEKRRLQLELEHAEQLKEQLTQRHDTMKAVVKARSETLQVMQEELSRVSIDYAEQLKKKEVRARRLVRIDPS
jgi:chromosome segregation ATPase